MDVSLDDFIKRQGKEKSSSPKGKSKASPGPKSRAQKSGNPKGGRKQALDPLSTSLENLIASKKNDARKVKKSGSKKRSASEKPAWKPRMITLPPTIVQWENNKANLSVGRKKAVAKAQRLVEVGRKSLRTQETRNQGSRNFQVRSTPPHSQQSKLRTQQGRQTDSGKDVRRHDETVILRSRPAKQEVTDVDWNLAQRIRVNTTLDQVPAPHASQRQFLMGFHTSRNSNETKPTSTLSERFD